MGLSRQKFHKNFQKGIDKPIFMNIMGLSSQAKSTER
jgi:hypothetical protein